MPTVPEPPKDATISNATPQSLDVAAAVPDPANGDAVTVQGYAFQCLDSSEAECDPNGPWFPSSNAFASDPTTPVTVSGLDVDTPYKCWAATVVGTSAPFTYACSDPVEASTLPFYPPSATAASGDVPNQVAVTGTAASPPNPGTTNLKVACVDEDGVCPDVGAPGWVAVGTSGTAEQVAKLSDGSTDLVGGTTYTCYSIEFDANDSNINECSDPMDAIAALNAPTLDSAAPGSSPAQIDVTASSPTGLQANANTQLKVSCVDQAQGCPDETGPWVDVQIDGSAQAVIVLNAGQTYTCFAAEFSTIDTTYRVCSSLIGTDAVAAMNAPTVAAETGLVGGAVSVTATAPLSSNQDSELKIACVADGGSCPAATGTSWIAATTSGSPQQVSALADGSSMVGGTAYTCYSAELSTTDGSYRMCSDKDDVTSKTLNAPSVTAASGTVNNQVAVTGTAPAAGNVGTSLKVSCVVQGGVCPDVGAPGWVAVTTSGTAEQVTTLSNGATNLVGGTTYTCWSADFDASNRVCSATGFDVVSSNTAPSPPPAPTGPCVSDTASTTTDWVLGCGNTDSCSVVCTGQGKTCTVGGMNAVTTQAKGDYVLALFGVPVTSYNDYALYADTPVVDFGSPTSSVFYWSGTASTCGAVAQLVISRRLCCCGPNCPVS